MFLIRFLEKICFFRSCKYENPSQPIPDRAKPPGGKKKNFLPLLTAFESKSEIPPKNQSRPVRTNAA